MIAALFITNPFSLLEVSVGLVLALAVGVLVASVLDFVAACFPFFPDCPLVPGPAALGFVVPAALGLVLEALPPGSLVLGSWDPALASAGLGSLVPVLEALPLDFLVLGYLGSFGSFVAHVAGHAYACRSFPGYASLFHLLNPQMLVLFPLACLWLHPLAPDLLA